MEGMENSIAVKEAQDMRRAPGILEMCRLISSEDLTVQYLREQKLLKSNCVCPDCSIDMSIIKNDSNDGEFFRCKSCAKKITIRKDSMFEVSFRCNPVFIMYIRV